MGRYLLSRKAEDDVIHIFIDGVQQFGILAAHTMSSETGAAGS